MKTLPISLLVVAACLAALLWTTRQAFAQGANLTLPKPQAVYDEAVKDAKYKGPGAGTGEDFCWGAVYCMGQFVEAYEASHDTAWLDMGVKFYDWCVDKMLAGPDGYKGFVGPMEDHPNLWIDVHVGDAVMMDRMLEFSELVKKNPVLQAKYGEAASKYVAIAKKDLIEKWDKRGTWHEDGEYGAYATFNRYCAPSQLTKWIEANEAESESQGLTLPFNKQNDMGQVCLKLFRITGEKLYLDKAKKIFAHMRSRFQYVADKDYYVWNYWEPFGPWDVNLEKKTTRHWMNVHGYRNYQAGEIGQIVEAYNTGIIFTPLDIERIINTNLKVMWAGDEAAPKWINSNALLPEPKLTEEQLKARKAEEAANRYSADGRAGTLWTALDQFNQTVRGLEALRYAKPSSDGEAQISKTYFENVTLKTPPGMDRKFAKDAKVEQLPVNNCLSLTVATVMPHILAADKPSIVLCKSRIDNELEVAVYSADGKDKKFVLHKGKIEGGTDGLVGIFILTWDGADPATKAKLPKGDYRMRWTVADGYREYAVTIP
jgi:hypothetical protein